MERTKEDDRRESSELEYFNAGVEARREKVKKVFELHFKFVLRACVCVCVGGQGVRGVWWYLKV